MSAVAASSVRQRAGKKTEKQANGIADVQAEDIQAIVAQTKATEASRSEWDFKLALGVITGIAFVLRFYGITHPDQVVFDEVHFGKFASYYLQRTYFFDVHPPFGKLLFAFMGWIVGYDGRFLFENIGDSYVVNQVPYLAYRSLPAILGTLTVSTVYCIMWESGYSLPACLVAAALICFDNAHIGQTRLILLDATLVFAMALSVLCYIRFYKLRHAPFGRKWWKWLLLTGVAMSCVISTKYVGVFTFFSIGLCVVIDLWDLMDVNRRQGALSLGTFGKHFAARVFGLILVPFFFYLFWFQVHFAVLSRSGPGDEFMTPEFQETLSDNLMAQRAVQVNYHDSITMRHKETKVYLHSHTENYPLRYDDGRVSSQGQQVTGYPHNDTNNEWEILPFRPFAETDKLGHQVHAGDLVRFRHTVTNKILLSHDVASPYFPTNQEFTAVDIESANGKRFNDTVFELRVEFSKPRAPFKSLSSHFKLIHNPTKIAMWTHTRPLPAWAFGQAEINGNKNVLQSSNVWLAEDIPSLPADSPRRNKQQKKVKHLPFLRKWVELQRLMFYHNNALTSSHPYATHPVQWPFLLRGVSFWTNNDTRSQIYFLGNPIGWWVAGSVLAIFAGIIMADQLSLRRGVDALDERTRKRLYNSTGFFFITWAAHYLPFYLMGRQLFLHHYLPAHLASSLVVGALLEFVFFAEPNIEDFNKNITEGKGKKKVTEAERVTAGTRLSNQNSFALWAASGVFIALLIFSWFFFAPLTYGQPGLDVAGVKARKWLGYDLHFAK